MRIFRRFKLHARYGMLLIFTLLHCTAFAASSTSHQCVEKQSPATIKPRLADRSQHHQQRLKTPMLPLVKPAPHILEVIPKDPNSTEPRRIIDIAPVPRHRNPSQNPSSAPTSIQTRD
ncbi:hypothetical protein [Acinetobacter nematophilus]|uniref:Secreted protein n=1 Tax=Acinetobacter nematophilus TaxID=2994642 RepID=A0A9X3DVH8_9GAMM|nr:hypothetical protein [Acinetobacter nematophilus]MCX5468871.1 hypothetical protein [Acinetobacter nematophilus]